MKNIFFTFIILFSFFSSCEKGEVFTGKPDPAVLAFENIVAIISSSETEVTAAQSFPIIVSIAPKVFDVDVLVEVISFLPNSNKRARRGIVIKAGETSAESTMNCPSADLDDLPFNLLMEVSVTSITTVPGIFPIGFGDKQYTISSNKLLFDYGDSTFATANSNRLALRLDWKDYNAPALANFNNLNWRLTDLAGVIVPISPSGQTTQPIHGTTVSTARYENLNFLSTANDGTYVLRIFAQKLISDPLDLPYRLTIRFPDNKVRVLAGVLNQISLGTATNALPKFKIVKETNPNTLQAEYEVTEI